MDTTNLWRTNLGTMDVGPTGLGSAIFGEGDAEAIAPARLRAGNDAGPSAVAAGGGSDPGGGGGSDGGNRGDGSGGSYPTEDTSAAAAPRGSRGIESAILGADGAGGVNDGGGPHGEDGASDGGGSFSTSNIRRSTSNIQGSGSDGASGNALSMPAGNAFPEKLAPNPAADGPLGADRFGAESFNAASYELNLSREEQTLYQHHLNQLALQRSGGSYVDGIVAHNGNGGARNGASNEPMHGATGPGTTAAASGNANGRTGPNPNAAPGGNATDVAEPNADAAAHGNASGAPSGNAPGSTGLNITAAPAGSPNRATEHEANGTTVHDGDGTPARNPNRASSNPAVLGQNRLVWIEGRTYVIPSVWDGKLVFTSEAVKRARQVGLEHWPSYANGAMATVRDEAMRTFMVQEASKPAETVPATAASQQARRNGDDILTDFHGWVARQDDRTRQSIGDYLRSLPFDGVPAARQKLAAMYAVAEQSGMDIFTVRENWELIRGGISEQQDWGSAKFDDKTFYNQLRHGAQERKGQRDLLLGSDADDAVGKASREASLGNFMFRSVLLGYSAPKAHRLWQQQASKLPNYRKEHEDLYLALSQDFHKEATTRLAPVYDLAREAFSAVFTFSDLEDASKVLHPRYSALSEEHQRLMLATVRAMADVMPDKTRQTFFSNLGEALGRGTSRTGRGLADFGSAWWELQKLELSFYLPFMSPSEQLQGMDQKIGEHNLESDLRRVQETDYSPIKQVMGDVMPAMVERAIYGTMDAIPSFALAAVPVVGLPATFASMTSNAYENVRFRGIDNGLSDADATKRAFLLAPIVALPEAALERLGVRAGLGKLPFLNKALDKLAGRIGGGVLGGTAKFVGRGVAETFTETAQGFMQPIVETIAHALDKDSPGVVWQNGKDGVLDGLWTQVPETFLTVLPFSGLGFFHRGARRVEGLSGASDLQLQAFGARLADIATFRDAVQRGEFSAEMAADELLQRRDANSPEARAAVEELTRLERAKAVEANAANVSAMEEAGVTRMARSADGWTVEHADGEVTRVNSARAALTVVHSLRQVETQREAEALVSMIDRWHDVAPAGVARETALTGQFATSDGRTVAYSRDGAVTREVTSESDARSSRRGDVPVALSPEGAPKRTSEASLDVAASMGAAGASQSDGTSPVRLGRAAHVATPRDLQRLREQARMDAQRGGHADIDVAINGANWVGKTGHGAREMFQRLEIHRSPSSALAFLHESVEADFRLGIQSGAITREETRQAIASVAKALDPARARDGAERAFRERVQRVASGTASEIELRETLSELAVADVLGRRRDGTTMPAGRVSAALEAALQTATDPTQVRAVGKLRAFLRAVRANLRAMFGTMAALRKARREGGAREFDALVSKLFGQDWQAAKEWKTSHEQDAASELDSDAAFSLSRRDYRLDERGVHPLAKPTTDHTITDHERARNPASVLQDVLRGESALREDVRTDRSQRWKHGRQIASRSRLLAWAERRDAVVLERASLLASQEREIAGGEHVVRIDSRSGRVVKLTKPALYGAHGDDAGAYLQRWALSNRVFGDDVRVEGIVTLPGEHEARVVISQRFVEGRDSTAEEIADYLMGKGFRRSSEGRWVQPITNLAVWDVAPGNAITSTDGQVHPIDLIIEPASPRELREVREESGIGVDLENQRPGQESRADEGAAFHLAPNASAIKNPAQTPGPGTQTQAASEIADRRAGATARRTLLTDVSDQDAGAQERADAPPGDSGPPQPPPTVTTTYPWKTAPTSAQTVIETLERELAPFEKKIAELKAKLERPKGSPPLSPTEFKARGPLREELAKLEAEAKALGRAIVEIPAAQRTRPMNDVIAGPIPPAIDRQVSAGWDIAAAYTHPDLLPKITQVSALPPTESSYYLAGEIHLRTNALPSIFAHELTHGTEQQNPNILKAALAFLKRRTVGEQPRKLSELTGNPDYKDHEVAYEDKWVERGGKVYTGKAYAGEFTTEILTMGIERLHADPRLFARQDPDYFSFVVNTLRRW